MNLLIVNDDEIAVSCLTGGIKWKDYGIDGEVFIAFNANEAIAVLERSSVDIILCDIEMPGKNGLELIRHVVKQYEDIECVFLTCHAKFEYAQEAIQLGCSNYILAPAPYDIIADAIFAAAERVTKKRKQNKLLRYGTQWLDEQAESARRIQGEKYRLKDIIADTEVFILANLSSSNLSVSSLAKRYYLSDDYLNRVFKRERGVSLQQYIIKSRMELAARLLKDYSLSISAISTQCGYSDYSHFVSMFKRFHGCNPSEYRKEKRA
ncbi:MAG: helix-turn-helix domain-containing protein [Oscillospiraceae bacterium]|nr:helix-turn-helix domain-containing protein [Oscillospiraceae bacterium]